MNHVGNIIGGLFKSHRVSFKESETLVSSVVLQADPSATTAPGEDCEKELETSALGPLAKLPPFRPVVITLLRLFDQPEVTMADVTRLVESDPAIISEILAIVNSPLFGFQGAVATAPHAISLLGLDRTRSLVSVLAMRAMMANSPRTPVVRRVWTHSVATAAIAQHLAPYFGVNKDFAHVAGIMHDLGRMGLLAAYTSSYTEIALSAHDSADSIMESERAACNMDHCQAGLLLARSWGLPDVLHNAIARHHEERHADQPASDGLIQLACALADSLQFQAILHRAAKPAEIINTRIEEERQEDIAAQLDTMQAQVLDTIQTLDF